jgi:hypothetical protein
MEHRRTRKLKALAAVIAVSALGAPVTQAAVQVDARHQALLDKATPVQVDSHHQILLRHHYAGELGYVSNATVQPTADSGSGDSWIGLVALGSLVVIGAGGAVVGQRKLASA